MVQIQRYLRRTNEAQNNRHFPLLNSLFVERFSKFNPYANDQAFKTYMKWAKKSPQLIGFLNIIATDMLSDNIEFFPLDKSSGRNKVLKATKFWKKNDGLNVAEETLYDLLITGIGYNWIGVLPDKQLKEFCELTLDNVYPEMKEQELEFKADQMFSMVKSENKDSLVKKLSHVASTTMTIHSDEYQVLKYIQRVGVNIKEFDPEEIIVFKLIPMDGKVFPFAPLESLLSELYLLWLITQNYVSYFENGGKPDNVFVLPKELAGSKNHKYLIDTLKKYKKIQNKHGNLVFTGEIDIEQLTQVETQMQHKDLGLYIVSILAMFYGIPVNRIPFLVGKAAISGDSGGMSDSGYWRKISVWQSKIETAYNKKLWNPYFGVDMKFGRGYLQDEVRETQNKMQMVSVAEQMMGIGLWTVEKAGEYMKVDEDVIREAQAQKKKRDEEEMKSGMLRQNLENNRNVIPNPDNRAKAKKKQATQNSNKNNSGGKRLNP